MSTFLGFLFSFSAVVVAFGAGVLWLAGRPASRAARAWLMAVTIAFAAASTYAVPYGVSRVLAMGYQPVDTSRPLSGKTAIVVLGSADEVVENWAGDAFAVLDRSGAARVWEACRVYRGAGDAWMISSGGGVVSQPGARATAATMRDALLACGVPSSRILLEDRSLTTRDQAVLVAPMVHALNTDRVVLVTSDIHMRRSVGAFRAAGVAVVPAIARDPFLTASWRKWYLPSPDGFELTERVAHEFAGIGYYAARGWFRL